MSRGDFKISFCVVCMNRLHQLKQTLIQNIIDNAEYENLEFVVLDYNSKDGMEEWVMQNLAEHIKTGRVVYYKTNEPDSWSPSHSKNLAFKLATGDIVCSIWADYFTGAGFAKYVNENFKADSNIVLTPIDFYKTKKGYHPPGDVLGKVCVKKSDFMRIHGFDERMNKHGFEDYDFINRLEMVGVKRVLIEDFSFLKYIAHDDLERYQLPDNLEGLYVNYKTSSTSDVLILYHDKRFERATLIDNSTENANDWRYALEKRRHRFEYGLKGLQWENGKWQNRTDGVLSFETAEDKFLLIKQELYDKNRLIDAATNSVFYQIASNEVIKSVLVFNHFYHTRSIMEKNLENKKFVVCMRFGKAKVSKNFNEELINV